MADLLSEKASHKYILCLSLFLPIPANKGEKWSIQTRFLPPFIFFSLSPFGRRTTSVSVQWSYFPRVEKRSEVERLSKRGRKRRRRRIWRKPSSFPAASGSHGRWYIIKGEEEEAKWEGELENKMAVFVAAGTGQKKGGAASCFLYFFFFSCVAFFTDGASRYKQNARKQGDE